MQTAEVLEKVIDSIATTTRYPRQVLTPNADLENDLGIDSVKRVEIVAALGIAFDLELTQQERDPSIRTIANVADWIRNSLQLKSDRQSASKTIATVEETILPAPVGFHAIDSNQTTTLSSMTTAVDVLKSHSDGRTHNGKILRNDFEPKTEPTPATPPATPPATDNQVRLDTPSSYSPNPPHFTPKSNIAPPTESLASLAEAASQSLKGKLAFVTGSGRGVGRTISRLLASKGATVIVNSFHSKDLGEKTAQEINDEGGTAFHLWGSIANPIHVDQMFNEIASRFGFLDILVCNASDGKIGSFCEVTQEDWERAFRTNVTGHYQCAMRARPLMQKRGGGSIVTMSSIAARRHVEGLGGQGVIKAAVESLTRHLACELAPLGIRANCVSGGPVYGQVMSMYQESRATLNYWETLVLDNELCSPIDLANTVAFLVSNEARGVNGAVWNVDHGLATRAHSRPLPKPMAEPPSSLHSLQPHR